MNHFYTDMHLNEKSVLWSAIHELRRAENKFPDWPADPIHAAAILAEECGELQKAVLQWVYEQGSSNEIYKEGEQVIAMGIRFLKNFKGYKPKQSEQIKKLDISEKK